jgi:serine-type D-Ala-D-Ala carboxypeptidase/endopeptidase (penicillin-binding protein 4)
VRRTAHRGGTGVRLTRWGALLGAVAIALTGCGGGSGASKTDSAPVAAESPSAPTTTPAGAGASRAASAAPLASGTANAPTTKAPPNPALTRLQAALTRSLRKAGPQSGALVYDLTARRTLFALSEGVGRPPASVEKLYTSLALLRMLGPDARLHTVVVGKGHMGPHGVWHGDLYLVGGGDPTFGDGAFNKIWESGYGPTAGQLVNQLTGRGIRRVTGSVIGDESLFDRRRGGMLTKLDADIPDLGGQLSALAYDHGATARGLNPGAFAARELTLALRADHVHAQASSTTGSAPARGQVLAVVSSPPLWVMLRLMDVSSDDLFAELFTKQLGTRFGGAGSIAAGAQVVASTVTSYGIHPRIVDGSGLSRSDRSSPREVVDLLRAVWSTPEGNILAASLPVVGVSGTVQTIAVHTPAQGNCIAKTGTLSYVTNLAGYCRRRHHHHELAFALMVDGPGNSSALVLESQMVAAIARY